VHGLKKNRLQSGECKPRINILELWNILAVFTKDYIPSSFLVCESSVKHISVCVIIKKINAKIIKKLNNKENIFNPQYLGVNLSYEILYLLHLNYAGHQKDLGKLNVF
jgi:hypothetical protein